MRFSDDYLREIAERNPIEEVVGEYVALTKRSGINIFGLCPFHGEKTPSFSVCPSRGIYHCFGCGKGGSVINFIMEIEHLDFPEAVEFLAKRAGMPLPERGDDPRAALKSRLYDLNRDAARWFYSQLATPAGAAAADYMARRQISPRTAKNFGLGFAPDSWDALTNAMKALGYSERELTEAGLVKRGKRGGVYDAFRNRLMFPVIDQRGSVIAFSGRILGDGEPKYLNSPETPIFSKSRSLFGINLAKKTKAGYMILVEGNVDVVSLHQAGFDSAVASLGTSLTGEQAQLLSRYTKKVVLCYDADGAGQKAAKRAIPLLDRLGLEVRVVTVPGAKDPDEFIKARGAEAFRVLIEESAGGVEYSLATAAAGLDLSSDKDKVAYLKSAADIISALPDTVSREVYALRVAEQCSVQPDAVRAAVNDARKRRSNRVRRAEERENTRPEQRVNKATPGVSFGNIPSARAEQALLAAFSVRPDLLDKGPDPEAFSSPELRNIYEAMRRTSAAGAEINAVTLTPYLSPEEARIYSSLLNAFPTRPDTAEAAIADCMARMDETLSAGDGDLMRVAQRKRNKFDTIKGDGNG